MLRLLFIVIVLVNCEPLQAETVVQCPEFCLCDYYKGLKRATCSDRKLYSIEINLPPQADILDLSYNQVSELGDRIFVETNLSNLKLLNLSHNKVSQIHLNGFEGLTKLKTLDLSYNALRYFAKSWFYSFPLLEELYLRGNNLKSINDEPKVALTNLKILDLSHCGIIHLKTDVFSNIPNLMRLDLSDNFLIYLSLEVLKPLKKLTFLNLRDNNFSCKGHTVVRLKHYCTHNGIEYKDPCTNDNKKLNVRKNVKFEKMVMEEKSELDGGNKNSWILNESEEHLSTNMNLTEVCTNFFSNVTSANDQGLLMDVINLNPWLVLLITLGYGIMIGMVLGCTLQMRPKRFKSTTQENDFPDGSHIYMNLKDLQNSSNTGTLNCMSNTSTITSKSNRHRSRSKSTGSSLSRIKGYDAEALMASEHDLANSTPMTPRKLYI